MHERRPRSTYAIVTAPAHGTLSALDADAGTVVYTAADDFAGTDTFTYRATNSGGDSAPATVTLDVTARPAVASTPSGDITLGDALTDTAKIDPRFEPKAGDTVEFRLYSGEACTGTPVFTSKADAGRRRHRDLSGVHADRRRRLRVAGDLQRRHRQPRGDEHVRRGHRSSRRPSAPRRRRGDRP